MNNQILVVEDEYNIGQSLVDILRLNDFSPTLATDGRTALDFVQSNHYDLILCDINLPDIDGYEILKTVRNNSRTFQTPFIFLSAFAEQNDVRKGMNFGADDYITKPFSMNTLIEAVRSRISQSEKSEIIYEGEIEKKWKNIISQNFNHEFLTPLNGILSASFLLEMSLPPDKLSEIKKLVDSIYVSGHRMLRNTRKLLTFALVNDNIKEIEETAQMGMFNAGELIKEVVHEAGYDNNPETLSLFLDSTPDFPGNAEFFRIIIAELLDNMVQFNQGGFPSVVTLQNHEQEFHLSFTNSLDHPLNFQMANIRQFRKYNNGNAQTGLGIGLFIVKKLSKAMDLELTVQEENNQICFSLFYRQKENQKSAGMLTNHSYFTAYDSY